MNWPSLYDHALGFLLGLMVMFLIMTLTHPSAANQMNCHEDEALVWVPLMPDSNKSTTRCVPIDNLVGHLNEAKDH